MRLCDEGGEEFARALVNYPAADLARTKARGGGLGGWVVVVVCVCVCVWWWWWCVCVCVCGGGGGGVGWGGWVGRGRGARWQASPRRPPAAPAAGRQPMCSLHHQPRLPAHPLVLVPRPQGMSHRQSAAHLGYVGPEEVRPGGPGALRPLPLSQNRSCGQGAAPLGGPPGPPHSSRAHPTRPATLLSGPSRRPPRLRRSATATTFVWWCPPTTTATTSTTSTMAPTRPVRGASQGGEGGAKARRPDQSRREGWREEVVADPRLPRPASAALQMASRAPPRRPPTSPHRTAASAARRCPTAAVGRRAGSTWTRTAAVTRSSSSSSSSSSSGAAAATGACTTATRRSMRLRPGWHCCRTGERQHFSCLGDHVLLSIKHSLAPEPSLCAPSNFSSSRSTLAVLCLI